MSFRSVLPRSGFVQPADASDCVACRRGLGRGDSCGIALGFAMRDTIENYVASLMLSLRQPFRANDHVVIEGEEGGAEG